PSQPSNRRSSASATHDRPGSTCNSSPRPPALSVPQAKQLWAANSNRPVGVSMAGRVADALGGEAVPVASDVKVLHLACLALDEVLARTDLLAHQHRADLVGQPAIIAVDLEERPRLGVHRRLPELVGVHLAEALEALNGQILDVEVLDDLVALLLALGVFRDLARTDPVERRLGDVEIALV